jgi:hypothetical protein
MKVHFAGLQVLHTVKHAENWMTPCGKSLLLISEKN